MPPKFRDVEWPLYSPHLTPPDFFLWGYLKDRKYCNPKSRTLDQLKDNIRKEINNIPQETFPAVMRNMAVRMQSVIGRRGGYIEHVIWERKVNWCQTGPDKHKMTTQKNFHPSASERYQFRFGKFILWPYIFRPDLHTFFGERYVATSRHQHKFDGHEWPGYTEWIPEYAEPSDSIGIFCEFSFLLWRHSEFLHRVS